MKDLLVQFLTGQGLFQKGDRILKKGGVIFRHNNVTGSNEPVSDNLLKQFEQAFGFKYAQTGAKVGGSNAGNDPLSKYRQAIASKFPGMSPEEMNAALVHVAMTQDQNLGNKMMKDMGGYSAYRNMLGSIDQKYPGFDSGNARMGTMNTGNNAYGELSFQEASNFMKRFQDQEVEVDEPMKPGYTLAFRSRPNMPNVYGLNTGNVGLDDKVLKKFGNYQDVNDSLSKYGLKYNQGQGYVASRDLAENERMEIEKIINEREQNDFAETRKKAGLPTSTKTKKKEFVFMANGGNMPNQYLGFGGMAKGPSHENGGIKVFKAQNGAKIANSVVEAALKRSGYTGGSNSVEQNNMNKMTGLATDTGLRMKDYEKFSKEQLMKEFDKYGNLDFERQPEPQSYAELKEYMAKMKYQDGGNMPSQQPVAEIEGNERVFSQEDNAWLEQMMIEIANEQNPEAQMQMKAQAWDTFTQMVMQQEQVNPSEEGIVGLEKLNQEQMAALGAKLRV